MNQLETLVQSIAPLDTAAEQQALMRQRELTKPPGSLGRLEALAVQLAGISGNAQLTTTRKAVVVMAADHGVTVEGVSAYPAEVTAQMVLNFIHGGAAINALARQAGARVVIVDVGVATPIEHPKLIQRKVAAGTANMAIGPAMSIEQALSAIQVGVDVVQGLVDDGLDLIAIGEMGIGNTTAASALTAIMTASTVAEVTGHGTGISDEQLQHKIDVIERAIAVNQPQRDDPIGALAKVGGLEIAGLVGVILAAAAQHIPVVLDGFIAGSAALVAVAISPMVRGYLIAGHASVELGHRVGMASLDLDPLLKLDMRLGEGTGAVLAMHIIEAAARSHNEMATFAEAEVSDREDPAD